MSRYGGNLAAMSWGLVHLDFGPSLRFRDYSAGDIIRAGLPYSLTIGFWAVVVASAVGVALGAAGELKRNTATDYLAETVGVKSGLGWYVATSILRRSPFPFRRFAPEWRAQMEGMIEAAEFARRL